MMFLKDEIVNKMDERRIFRLEGKWMEISKEQLKKYTGLLEDWIPKGAAIAIAVRGEYIYYAAGKQDLRLQKGQKVKAGKYC